MPPLLQLSRRSFLDTSGRLVVGAAIASVLDAPLTARELEAAERAERTRRTAKLRMAVVGTGIRATRAWGRELLAEQGERVEIVGLCDVNRTRAEASRRLVGIQAP